MIETADPTERQTIDDLKSSGKSFLCKMDASGDKRIAWLPDNAEEVKEAKKEFDKLKKAGWTFFTIGLGGKQTKITKFNPEVSQIIAVPPIQGG